MFFTLVSLSLSLSEYRRTVSHTQSLFLDAYRRPHLPQLYQFKQFLFKICSELLFSFQTLILVSAQSSFYFPNHFCFTLSFFMISHLCFSSSNNTLYKLYLVPLFVPLTLSIYVLFLFLSLHLPNQTKHYMSFVCPTHGPPSHSIFL